MKREEEIIRIKGRFEILMRCEYGIEVNTEQNGKSTKELNAREDERLGIEERCVRVEDMEDYNNNMI